MKIRQTIKKAVALGTGALMLGATILGASAANVSDYPSAFIKDGKVTAKIVVGEKAQVIDVVGAIDIAADLQSKAVSTTAVETSGNGVSVAGGKTEDVFVTTGLNTDFGTLDDSDLTGLQNTQVTVDIASDAEDFDVSDNLVFTSGISVETGLTADAPNEDFKDNLFLQVAKDSVSYVYNFDDALTAGHYLQNATADDPIEIEFLGQTLSISGATSTSITVDTGVKQFLNVGDVLTATTGQKVKLVRVSDTAAVVDVDGVILTINDGSTKSSAGIRVKVDDIFNDDGTTSDSATLIVGEDVTKTYTDGEEYIGQNEDDPDWTWNLDLSTPADPVIGVNYEQTLDDADEVVMMGSKLSLPNDFATVYIDSVNQAGSQDYKIGTSIEELRTADGTEVMATSAHVVHFESLGNSDDGFLIAANSVQEKTDDIYAYFNNTGDRLELFWKDKDDNKIKHADPVVNDTADNVFSIDYKDTSLTVDFSGYNATEYWNVTIDTANQDVVYRIETAASSDNFDYVGDSDGDTTTANDVRVGTRDISGWEQDTMTQNGLVLYSYDAMASSDEYKFSVPRESGDFKVNVVVATKNSVVSSASGGSVTTDKVNPIGVDFGVLDKDAPAAGSSNLIVVGGPCVNTVAARLAGNPADCTAGFVEGEAKLTMFDDNGKVALLVAGYSGLDTSGATRALINEVLPMKSSAALTTINSKQPKFK